MMYVHYYLSLTATILFLQFQQLLSCIVLLLFWVVHSVSAISSICLLLLAPLNNTSTSLLATLLHIPTTNVTITYNNVRGSFVSELDHTFGMDEFLVALAYDEHNFVISKSLPTKCYLHSHWFTQSQRAVQTLTTASFLCTAPSVLRQPSIGPKRYETTSSAVNVLAVDSFRVLFRNCQQHTPELKLPHKV